MDVTEVDAADEAEPIEEPRGPRLPDALVRIPFPAWIFIFLAVGDLIWYMRDPGFPANPSVADYVVYVLRIAPAIASILLPAALLTRHPDAWQRARTLLFGTILFAAVQGLLILAEPLQPVFEGLTPATEELPFLVPLAAAYNVLIGLVAAFGLAYVALGLSQARRYEDASIGANALDPTALFIPVATVLATIVGVISVSRLELGDTPMSPALAIYLASSVVLGILRVAVWAYLAAVATRGWRADEEPIAGWRLAAGASGLVLAALALVNLSGLIGVQDQAIVTIYGYVVATAYALGYVLLLAAFVVGLPATDEATAAEDDQDDGADESGRDQPELDEDGWPIGEAALVRDEEVAGP